jgi:hypothetical protein
MLGMNVNNIAEFMPSSIPNIVCWLRAEKDLTRSKTIGEYASQVSNIEQRSKMIQQYRDDLSKVVITEIISDTPGDINSFVRNDETSTTFPELHEFPGKISSINMSNYVDPSTQQLHTIQLISNLEFDLPDNFSYFTNWNGNIKVEYSKISKKILIYSDLVKNPPTSEFEGKVFVQPTAELIELIIYSRELELNEKQILEGYIAYKRNEQYNLPINHPYLPDLTLTEVSFLQINTDLTAVQNSIQEGLNEIEALYQKYKMYNGPIDEHDMQKGLAITALNEIRELRFELSKGALYARMEKAININAVYRAITDKKWDKNQIFTKDTMQSYIAVFQRANTALQGYLDKLRNFNVGNSVQLKPSMQGGGGPTSNTEALDFYNKLRAVDMDVKLDGNDAYNTLQTAHARKIEDMLEVLQGHTSTEIAHFESLKSRIWTPITDPAYENVEAYKTKIVEYLTIGDYAYLIRVLKKYNTLASTIKDGYLIHKSHVIFTETYVGFIEYINRLCTKYIGEIKNIKERIETCFKQHDAVNHPEVQVPVLEPVTLTPTKYISTITKRYISAVNYEDRHLFNFEYIEVTEAGLPIRDEKMGIVLIFPSKMDIVHNATGFLFNEKEEFIIRDELKDSIIQYMTEKYKPSCHQTAGPELDRMKKNSVCFISAPVHPLVLPTHGLIPGDFFMVYNTCKSPICVLNSGKTQLRTLIGPWDTLLFIYTATEMPYGYVPWSINYLPYDTLLDAPRSNRSSYIPELGVEIYVKETGIQGKFFEPVYDDHWNFVEVRRWDDGKVYDIDDVNHVNPYDVTKGVNQSIHSLLPDAKRTNNFHTMGRIYVYKDPTTAVPLLCSNKGVVPNEFGYAKCAQTPLIFVDGVLKIRGAYTDLILDKYTETAVRTCPIEPYLTYTLLFTTEYVRPVVGSTQSIYVTMNQFPIITADGKFLEINPTFVTTHALGTPYELNGVPTQPYNQVDIMSFIQAEEQGWNQARANQHFENGTQFLQSTLNDLESKITIINALGGEAQSSIASINTLSAEIRGDIGSITPTTIDAKLDTYINSYKNMMKELEPMLTRVEQTKSYRKNYEYLEKDGLAKISQHISQIQNVEQDISSRTGMTQVQAIHRLHRVAETKRDQFLHIIHTIRNKIDGRTLNDLDHLFDEAKANMDAVERIAMTDLSNGIADAGKEYSQVILTSIRRIYTDLMSKKRFANKIALWLGVHPTEQTAYDQLEPIPSGTMNTDIYTQYDNPLFMRDWANVPNIQADTLKQQAITILTLLNDLPEYDGQSSVEHLREILTKYETILKSVNESMNALQINIKEAYKVLEDYSKKLQSDNQDRLNNKIATINECVQRIEGKLTALQTLQMRATGDMGTYYTLHSQYETLKSHNQTTLTTNIMTRRLDQKTINDHIHKMDQYWQGLLQIETSIPNALV